MERIANDYDCNYLTLNQFGFVKTSGRKVEWCFWWYLDESHEAAIRTDTFEFLTEKEMEKYY